MPLRSLNRRSLVRQAVAGDATTPDELARVLDHAAALGVYAPRVIVVPKAPGMVEAVPEDYVVGLSVPTSFGATASPYWEYRDRRVHRLGGAPHAQLRLAALLGPAVVSVDRNCHLKASRYGTYWEGGRWVSKGEAAAAVPRGPDLPYRAFARSCANIAAAWAAHGAGRPVVRTTERGSRVDEDQVIRLANRLDATTAENARLRAETLAGLQRDINAWQAATFPRATLASAFRHLRAKVAAEIAPPHSVARWGQHTPGTRSSQPHAAPSRPLQRSRWRAPVAMRWRMAAVGAAPGAGAAREQDVPPRGRPAPRPAPRRCPAAPGSA